MKLNGLPNILVSVSKVEVLAKERVISTATGFFYKAANGHEFFVTNRHVVRGIAEQEKLPKAAPDTLSLNLHIDRIAPQRTRDFSIPLFDKKGNALFHEPENAAVDVVIVSIEHTDVHKALIEFITPMYRLPDEFAVTAGEDVIVLGYPHGFFDTANNLPIFRSASIASIYGVNFQGLERCLLDGNLQSGMSGSPIFLKPSHARVTCNGELRFMTSAIDCYFFIGMLSQIVTVPVAAMGNLPCNVGLSDCWYPSTIESLALQASQLKRR